jgi:hypothetical protein
VTVCEPEFPPGTDQERDEEGERHDLGDLGLEVPEHRSGQRLGREEEQQPEKRARMLRHGLAAKYPSDTSASADMPAR